MNIRIIITKSALTFKGKHEDERTVDCLPYRVSTVNEA